MSTFKGRSPLRPLFALIASGAFVAAAQVPTVAHAAEQIEEVVVTGSRIARDPNQVAPSPVQTISEADIRLSGEVDITDLLRQQPALLTSTSVAGSVDGVFATSVGQAVLNLRGLGNERTLTLVNGRRHVAGVAGSQAVDVGSIPPALIERVEVLTGGASSIYGADAVTGVVNFVLKDDFEGLDLDFQGGMSGESDGESFQFSGLFGKNFADGRGNFTIGVDVVRREGIKAGDRNFARNNGIADSRNNPALRFQAGDIDPTSTPNFAQFYDNATTGRFPVSFPVPQPRTEDPDGIPDNGDEFELTAEEAFQQDFFDEFGVTPTLSAAELALLDRAGNAPPRTIDSQHTFSITSTGGVIMGSSGFIFADPANGFAPTMPQVDLDGNGVHDCLDSSVGYQSTDEFFPNAVGFLGGCWNIEADGTVEPYQDGLVASLINQYGGDGIPNSFDQDLLTPDVESYALNFTGRFDISDNLRVFGEAKYVNAQVESGGPLNTFWDLLPIRRDNPFLSQLPADLQTYLDAQELTSFGIADFANNPPPADTVAFITRDPSDLGPNITKNTRETMRFVAGLEGELDNGMAWDVSANYGQFERKFRDRNRVIIDRYFAALDAIDDGSGNPICRSDVEGAVDYGLTPFDIPLWKGGYYTFNPGDGQCAPMNVFGGVGGVSQEAVDFITQTVVNEFTITQFVLNGNLNGELDFFELPGGKIAFNTGAEYRKETSEAEYDPLVLGQLTVDAPDGNAGDLLVDLNPDTDPSDGIDPFQNSLVFDPATQIFDYDEDYDVWEVYAEVSLPILSGARYAEELTIDAAARYSDYSTIGTTETWSVGGAWAPIQDVRFRGTISRAVRAPNIFELFGREGAFFRPDDPCEAALVDAQPEPFKSNRITNCQNISGIDATTFTDPLTARFSGLVTGNEDLDEEEADTWTIGVQIQPRFLEGLMISVDYWDIEIDGAIEAVSAQDIVDGCYDADPSASPNQFCSLFTRRADGGLNFLEQSQLNLGSLESAGVDFSATYNTELFGGTFGLGVMGTWVDKIDRYFDPNDPTAVDPELGEVQRPEYAGSFTASYGRGPWMVRWRTMYQDEQVARDAEIEDAFTTYGQVAFQDEFYSHDISGYWDYNDQIQIYGGVNNVTDEEPNLQEGAWPVSPMGRYFFVGVSYQGM